MPEAEGEAGIQTRANRTQFACFLGAGRPRVDSVHGFWLAAGEQRSGGEARYVIRQNYRSPWALFTSGGG